LEQLLIKYDVKQLIKTHGYVGHAGHVRSHLLGGSRNIKPTQFHSFFASTPKLSTLNWLLSQQSRAVAKEAISVSNEGVLVQVDCSRFTGSACCLLLQLKTDTDLEVVVRRLHGALTLPSDLFRRSSAKGYARHEKSGMYRMRMMYGKGKGYYHYGDYPGSGKGMMANPYGDSDRPLFGRGWAFPSSQSPI
jgi:hypothetical protein